MTKNERIKQSLLETRMKRASQVCRVYTVKVDESKLKAKQKEQIKMLFVEAKRFYNHILNWANNDNNDIFEFSRRDCKEVSVLNKEKEQVTLPLQYLTSSLKNSIHQQICSSIKTISKLKKKGIQKHGGRLKFLSDYKSLNFNQNGITHKIKSKNTIKLQGISKNIKVDGLKQFIDNNDIEVANLKLLNTPKGYYIAITTFINKELINKPEPTKEKIGIDFGCTNTLNISNGEKINVRIEETDRLKRLQRKLQKKSKRSNNFNKTKLLLNVEYQKLINKKNDISNKIVARLKEHELIVIQDEQLTNWAKNKHGKAISHSVLGRVKAKLKTLENVIILDKFIPTTKLCTICGKTHEVNRWDKTFSCCGFTEDRDIHAAKTMLWIAQNIFGPQIRLGRTKFKRGEFNEKLNLFDFNER